MEGREVAVIDGEVVDMDTGEMGMALAPRREAVGGLLRPVAQPSEVLEAQEDVRRLVEGALKGGRDFDTIPGTSKPTLLKPGAERITAAFGCAPRFEVLEQEVDHDRWNEFVKRSWEWHPTIRGKKVWSEEEGTSQGLYRYVLRCQLVHRESGVVIGEGVGSCSTMESKYIDRPRDLENTVLKMGKKRAFIDAVLTTFGLSEQFTQDVEDGGFGNGEKDREPISLDAKLGFGKHRELTWAELLEKDRQYAEWAHDNLDKLTEEDRAQLSSWLMDTKPGGAPAGAEPASAPAPKEQTGDMIDCPVCSGPMWDNREDKRSPKAPDLKCKSKECDSAIWLGTWASDTRKRIAAAVEAGVLTAELGAQVEKRIEGKSPAQLLKANEWLDGLATEQAA